MPRMHILTPLEQETFERPPQFTYVERKHFCDFPIGLHAIANTLRSPTNRIGFLVSCAYFRATKRFFPIHQFHMKDIEYVAKHGGLAEEGVDVTRYDKESRIRHQERIRAFYGFTLFDTDARTKLLVELRSMVQARLSPKHIF